LKIFIGSDHGGYKLKKQILSFLYKLGYYVADLGNKNYEPDDDYPIYAKEVAKTVAKTKDSIGILICGSGQGVCIVANKVRGIRAALAEHIKDAYLARKDDDSNVLCLSGRILNSEKANKIVKKFLETKFEDLPKRKRRLMEIKKFEK